MTDVVRERDRTFAHVLLFVCFSRVKRQAYIHKGDVIVCDLDGVVKQNLVNDRGVRAMEVQFYFVDTKMHRIRLCDTPLNSFPDRTLLCKPVKSVSKGCPSKYRFVLALCYLLAFCLAL